MISAFLRSLRQCIPGCDCLLCKRKAVGSQIRIRGLPHGAAEAPDKMIDRVCLAALKARSKCRQKELLTNYGELALIWFDTPNDITDAQSKELYQMVKHYQSNCLINSRISRNESVGDYRSWGDNEIPEEYQKNGLFETPATLNDTWGYKSFDENWKSAEEVLRLKRHLNARGINYLLNVGPDPMGRIPAPAQEILRRVGTLG